jgi:hypothetical protein
MLPRLRRIAEIVRRNLLMWSITTCSITALYYVGLLIAVIIKFGELPNYVNYYHWFDNVQRIIASTPSVKDQLAIIKDEWLIEIGYMNYDFGIGLAEWSLFIVPITLLEIALLSALMTTYWLLLRERRKSCAATASHSTNIAGGVGSSCVALTSITLSWVVCCSTPTWVVGLAMMGLGVSTALWLEPIGAWVNLFGFVLLIGAIVKLAGDEQPHLAARPMRLQRA